uniref:Uncharacterized protein n=1 Tax=Aquila chrysaetos chrysaetos TaxID=223781 RepID=A0A663EF75_AQUCH
MQKEKQDCFLLFLCFSFSRDFISVCCHSMEKSINLLAVLPNPIIDQFADFFISFFHSRNSKLISDHEHVSPHK